MDPSGWRDCIDKRVWAVNPHPQAAQQHSPDLPKTSIKQLSGNFSRDMFLGSFQVNLLITRQLPTMNNEEDPVRAQQPPQMVQLLIISDPVLVKQVIRLTTFNLILDHKFLSRLFLCSTQPCGNRRRSQWIHVLLLQIFKADFPRARKFY